MTNPFDAIKAPVRNLHKQRSHTGTLINYEEPTDPDSDDWYDEGSTDSNPAELPAETVAIYVERSEQASTRYGGGGIEIEADVVIVVDPTEPDGPLVGADEDRPASEIVDPTDSPSTRYRVMRVVDDGSGVVLLDAERIDR
jgi:hypothetical protein